MKDNQHEQLFEGIPAVQELDNETAAAIQGGYSLELYDDDDAKLDQLLGSFDFGGKPRLISNDKISTIVINDDTKWRFYIDADYKGDSITFGKGTHRLRLSQYPNTRKFNNNISSFIQVG